MIAENNAFRVLCLVLLIVGLVVSVFVSVHAASTAKVSVPPKFVQLVVYEDTLLGLDDQGQLYKINYRRSGEGWVPRGSETPYTFESIYLSAK